MEWVFQFADTYSYWSLSPRSLVSVEIPLGELFSKPMETNAFEIELKEGDTVGDSSLLSPHWWPWWRKPPVNHFPNPTKTNSGSLPSVLFPIVHQNHCPSWLHCLIVPGQMKMYYYVRYTIFFNLFFSLKILFYFLIFLFWRPGLRVA